MSTQTSNSHRPLKGVGDPKRGILPTNLSKVTFKSLKSDYFPGSPFSDPPLGDGEMMVTVRSNSNKYDHTADTEELQ